MDAFIEAEPLPSSRTRKRVRSILPWLAVSMSALLAAVAQWPGVMWPLVLVAAAPVASVLLGSRGALGWRLAMGMGLAYAAAVALLALAFPDSWPVATSFSSSWLAAIPFVVAFPLLARLSRLGAGVGVMGGAAIWTVAGRIGDALAGTRVDDAAALALQRADVVLSGLRAQTPVANLLALGGPSLLTFTACCLGMALGLAWAERRHAVRRGRAVTAGAVVFGALLALADFAVALAPSRVSARAAAAPREPLRIALVQPGAAAASASPEKRFEGLVELTRTVDVGGAQLLLWPAPAKTQIKQPDGELGDSTEKSRVDVLRALARERGVALLVAGEHLGAMGATGVSHGASLVPATPVSSSRSTAFLFPSDGATAVQLEQDVALRTSPSDETAEPRRVFSMKGWNIGPLLGDQTTRWAQVSARVEAGAELLVDLTAQRTPVNLEQTELSLGSLSLVAAAARRPVVRVTEAGVTALVLENGLLSWRFPLGSPAAALLDVIAPTRDALGQRGGQRGFDLMLGVLALAAALLPVLLRPTSSRTKSQEINDG